MPKVTIKEIAMKAGVSKTSVSFAFNNPDRLSEATLHHILKVADELGYVPDPLASNLKTRRTGCIGLLMPQPIPAIARNPHTFDFIEGVGRTCHEAGISLMLVPPLKGNLRRAIVRAAVDGFLAMGLEPFRKTIIVLQQRAVPFVMVDSEPTPGIPCINIDDETGAYMAMTCILKRKPRNILILGMQSEHAGNHKAYTGLLRRRVSGYLRALSEVGLSIEHRRVRLIECRTDAADGAEAFRSVWRSGWKPDAVVAMADVLAIGVLQAAKELGVRIPDDLAVIGYDDIEFSQLTNPPLTTIRQPIIEKGQIAARLLIDLIDGNEVGEYHIILPVELIERATCSATEV